MEALFPGDLRDKVVDDGDDVSNVGGGGEADALPGAAPGLAGGVEEAFGEGAVGWTAENWLLVFLRYWTIRCLGGAEEGKQVPRGAGRMVSFTLHGGHLSCSVYTLCSDRKRMHRPWPPPRTYHCESDV